MKQSSPPSRSAATTAPPNPRSGGGAPRPSTAPRPSGPPRSGSKPKSTKPKAPTPPLSANERGVQRRARKKAERRRKNWLVWLGFCAATAVIGGTAAGVRSELNSAKARVASKQATLKALQNQLNQGKKRLSAFNGGSGRERALAENGFIRPGERILLFPRDNKTTR